MFEYDENKVRLERIESLKKIKELKGKNYELIEPQNKNFIDEQVENINNYILVFINKQVDEQIIKNKFGNSVYGYVTVLWDNEEEFGEEQAYLRNVISKNEMNKEYVESMLNEEELGILLYENNKIEDRYKDLVVRVNELNNSIYDWFCFDSEYKL